MRIYYAFEFYEDRSVIIREDGLPLDVKSKHPASGRYSIEGVGYIFKDKQIRQQWLGNTPVGKRRIIKNKRELRKFYEGMPLNYFKKRLNLALENLSKNLLRTALVII